jgi:hypothetical protein
MSETAEQMFVQTFIAQSAIEALDEPVLHWLAWLNVMPFDCAFFLPLKNGVAGQFCAVTGLATV